MHVFKLAAAAALLGSLALPALAQDKMGSDDMKSDEMMSEDSMMDESMGTMGMMEGGEVMTFMGDGHMGKTVVTDKAMMDQFMAGATPIEGCVMIMTGADGKTYMVDTSMQENMDQCQKMAM